MTTRERLEAIEAQNLSPYAAQSQAASRRHPMPSCDLRTQFQRDRDRILHSKAFRRLKHKTQVFLSPGGDHFRTRLTHTLEVSQIARTITRALRLNEDLAEAIALGHDLGHTPFGHMGERTLAALNRGFSHNEQSLRVVERLERGGEGLNLTDQVRDGILRHSGDIPAGTLEGVAVGIADRIAYINHDLDDAMRAGVIAPQEIPDDLAAALGETHGSRIDIMIRDVIISSEGTPEVRMSDRVRRATDSLREFLFKRVYHADWAIRQEAKTDFVIRALWGFYIAHPNEMSDRLERNILCDGINRAVADHIAGMTDRYAIERFNEIFVPSSWDGGY